MDPQRLLRKMCDRHGLPYGEVERLEPLVQRALQSPESVRDRILTMVETNLAKRNGTTTPESSNEALFQDLDEEVLISVARVLHAWAPSGKVLDVGGALPRLFPEGLKPEDLEDIEE